MNSAVIEITLMLKIGINRPVEIHQLADGREIPEKKVSASRNFPVAIPDANCGSSRIITIGKEEIIMEINGPRKHDRMVVVLSRAVKIWSGLLSLPSISANLTNSIWPNELRTILKILMPILDTL